VLQAGSHYNQPRVPLSPIFSALGALLVALDGDIGWRYSTAIGDHVPAARDKDSVGRLLVGGVLDDDIMELPSGVSDDVIRSS
jgi:hypothetical protein